MAEFAPPNIVLLELQNFDLLTVDSDSDPDDCCAGDVLRKIEEYPTFYDCGHNQQKYVLLFGWRDIRSRIKLETLIHNNHTFFKCNVIIPVNSGEFDVYFPSAAQARAYDEFLMKLLGVGGRWDHAKNITKSAAACILT